MVKSGVVGVVGWKDGDACDGGFGSGICGNIRVGCQNFGCLMMMYACDDDGVC